MKKKFPRDMNRLAKAIADMATSEYSSSSDNFIDNQEDNKFARRAKKAGLTGGNARASVLSPEERIEIAKKAKL